MIDEKWYQIILEYVNANRDVPYKVAQNICVSMANAILKQRDESARPAMGDDVVERVSHAMQSIPKSLDETTQQLWERRAKAALAAIPAPAPADEAVEVLRCHIRGAVIDIQDELKEKLYNPDKIEEILTDYAKAILAALNQQKGEK